MIFEKCKHQTYYFFYFIIDAKYSMLYNNNRKRLV